MKKRAVFLDRDGTLSLESGYPADPNDVLIYPASFAAVRKFNKTGLLAVVTTNQSGVGRGLLTEETLAAIHQKFMDTFAAHRARLDAIYYCPHYVNSAIPAYQKRCDCRKPATGLARRAAAELEIDLRRSYTIGDKPEDVIFGINIGATPILVLTGYGRQSLDHLRRERHEPAYVATDILAAALWILAREKAHP